MKFLRLTNDVMISIDKVVKIKSSFNQEDKSGTIEFILLDGSTESRDFSEKEISELHGIMIMLQGQ